MLDVCSERVRHVVGLPAVLPVEDTGKQFPSFFRAAGTSPLANSLKAVGLIHCKSCLYCTNAYPVCKIDLPGCVVFKKKDQTDNSTLT